MKISFDVAALKRSQWYEYAIRFLFGGAITAVTGVLAKQYGPVFGGLFLAFPAIFPAGATLVQKHETEKKQRAGITDKDRGRKAAALEASGACMGSLGLTCFALIVWQLLTRWSVPLCFLTALTVWLGLSILLWRTSKMPEAKKKVIKSLG